jgi:integrase
MPPVGPVDDAVVDATLSHLNRQVAGLVRFQRLTGCRPGDACLLRRCDIDTSVPVWVYTPSRRNGKHRGRPRAVHIGPEAQQLLAEFPTADPADYVFDPRTAVAERNARRSAERQTPRYPSHMERNAAKRVADPKRAAGARYTSTAYAHAVARACDTAKVPHWHPNQLRHTFATRVRREFGLEEAQVVLGPEKAGVAPVYREKNRALAARVTAEIG